MPDDPVIIDEPVVVVEDPEYAPDDPLLESDAEVTEPPLPSPKTDTVPPQ